MLTSRYQSAVHSNSYRLGPWKNYTLVEVVYREPRDEPRQKQRSQDADELSDLDDDDDEPHASSKLAALEPAASGAETTGLCFTLRVSNPRLVSVMQAVSTGKKTTKTVGARDSYHSSGATRRYCDVFFFKEKTLTLQLFVPSPSCLLVDLAPQSSAHHCGLQRTRHALKSVRLSSEGNQENEATKTGHALLCTSDLVNVTWTLVLFYKSSFVFPSRW